MNRKRFQSLIIILAVVLINIASGIYYFRTDLTKDKRYTLGDYSKKSVKSLDDQVFVRVYLGGELPAGFRRLKDAIKELLFEFRAYNRNMVQFEFIDPLAGKTKKEQDEILNELYQLGLEPVDLEVKEDDNTTRKIIIPGAIVMYKNKSIALNLLKQQIGLDPDEVLNNSIINLEYEFINALKKLRITKKKNVAFITGHGELEGKPVLDIYNTLSDYCNVKTIELPHYKVGVLDAEDLIIIAKPDTTFSNIDKYQIDQFIMKGGSVLWLIDALHADMDSLRTTGSSITTDYPLNLSDQLFEYGVKILPDLVQDLNCHYIPIFTTDGPPKQDFRKWIFYPLANPANNHPIVNNINTVWFRFANSIDTLDNPGIKKTILLQSSLYSRIIYNPAQYSLKILAMPVPEQLFQSGPKNLAVMLEGSFISSFRNRISPSTLSSGEYGKFVEKGKNAKMIVVSDGDIIASQISRIKDQVYPLGYDHFTNQTFGNKIFLQNCIDYLLDDSGIMQLRSKDLKLRLLDKSKIKKTKTQWQVINLVLPIVAVLIFGVIFNILRKRRFTK